MGKNVRRRRDGSGPFRSSAQRKLTGNRGKRKLAGQKCPQK